MSRDLRHQSFTVDRRPVADTGVPPVRIGPPLNVPTKVEPGIGVVVTRPLVEPLAFQRREEAFGHRVVVSIAHRASGGSPDQPLASLTERQRGVLTAVIRVVDDIHRSTLGNWAIS